MVLMDTRAHAHTHAQVEALPVVHMDTHAIGSQGHTGRYINNIRKRSKVPSNTNNMIFAIMKDDELVAALQKLDRPPVGNCSGLKELRRDGGQRAVPQQDQNSTLQTAELRGSVKFM